MQLVISATDASAEVKVPSEELCFLCSLNEVRDTLEFLRVTRNGVPVRDISSTIPISLRTMVRREARQAIEAERGLVTSAKVRRETFGISRRDQDLVL